MGLEIHRDKRGDNKQRPPHHFLGQEDPETESQISSKHPKAPRFQKDIIIIFSFADIRPISFNN